MGIRRRARAFVSAALLLATTTLYAQTAEQPRASAEERKEAQAIEALLSAGKIPANDLALTWLGSDALRSQNNKIYVPFTVTLDPAAVTTGRVTVYWRVTSADAPVEPPPPPPRGRRNKGDAREDAVPEYLSIVALEPGQTAPFRVSRAVAVSPGAYELSVIVKETPPAGKKLDHPARVGFVRQSLSVPDFWSGDLTTSSVIVGSRIDPLPAPLTPAQLFERPYALGNIEVIPAGTTRFSKRDELSVFMMIYNAKVDASNAPDVMVEFNFFNVANGSEKYFNRTNPQALNAQTVSGLDPATGLPNGQTVPLGAFPEGDYRMEIKVTDKLAGKAITRDVKFSVAGS